jgi:ankyrin repeat protein
MPTHLNHGPSDRKLTRLHDKSKHAPPNSTIRIQQPDETRFFKRIHYHRQIPVKRLVMPPEGGNEKEVCRLELDSLPPLHRAAATCSIKVMADLINAGTDVNFKLSFHMQTDWFEFHGASPLLIAAWFGKMKSIEFLLEHGANLNALDSGRGGIMEYAICGPCKGRIINRLLTYGADPNIKHYDGCILLHLAAEHGLFWIIDLLVELGNELDAPWDLGKTPLFFAALEGHTETVRTLLDLGAATEIRTEIHEWTPLHTACWEDHEAVVELLLDYGADIGALSTDQENSLHLASRAGHLNIVRLLLEHGADYSALDVDQESPLHLAARAGHLDTVILLLEYGADMHAKNNNGMTALHVALCNSREETAKSLLSIPGANHPDEYGYTCLHWAAGAGLATVVRQIILDGSDIEALPFPPANSSWFGGTALSWASRDGQTEAVKVLLELGANVNTSNPSDKESALHKAARHDHVDIGRLLIEHGANIEHRNSWGNTPLLVAAMEGSVKSTTILLEAGANFCEGDDGWNAWDYAAWNESESLLQVLLQHKADLINTSHDHWTALHCAALKGYQTHAKILLEHGCDIEAKDNLGRTALYLAVLATPKKQLLELLLKHGCKLILQDASGMAPWDYKGVAIPPTDVLDLFITSGWDLDKPYHQGRTIFHTAIIDGNENVLDYLLNHGCRLSLLDKDGCTPWGNIQRGPLPTKNVLDLLIAHGWNIDEPNGKGYTTLHTAVLAGGEEAVKYLISLGCNVDTRADDGRTPMDTAIEKGDANIQALVREASRPEKLSALTTHMGTLILD